MTKTIAFDRVKAPVLLPGNCIARPFRRTRRIQILPSKLLVWRQRYAEHLVLTGIPTAFVRRRVAWAEDFLSFLASRNLFIEDSDNAYLTRKYLKQMQGELPFNRKRIEYRYREACKLVNFIPIFTPNAQPATAVPPKAGAGFQPFRINSPGPRDESILRKVLDYESKVFPSEEARIVFDSMYRVIVDHLLAFRVEAGTWNSYRNAEQDLKSFLKFIAESNSWMPVNALTKETLHQFQLWCIARELSPNSIRRFLTSVRRLLKTVPGVDPMVYSIKGPKLTHRIARPMDLEDALDLIEAIDPCKDSRSLQNRAILELLLGCGLRIGEVLRITPDSIFRDRTSGRVKALIQNTKNKREHIVLIPPRTIPLLEQLERRAIAVGMKNTYFIQQSDCAKKTSYENFRKDFKRALARAGLDTKKTIHALRATFATTLLARGVPREKVSDLLNHTNPSSILPYDGFTGTDREELVRHHHPMFQEAAQPSLPFTRKSQGSVSQATL